MEVRFRLVDVFTERPFAGNQLCVVPDPPAELSSEQMQMLAAEIAFSETTFVTEAAADRYAMRIFTPAEELPFAGHPTLGTALALVSDGRVGSHPVQTTKAGTCRWRWTSMPVSRGCASSLRGSWASSAIASCSPAPRD